MLEFAYRYLREKCLLNRNNLCKWSFQGPQHSSSSSQGDFWKHENRRQTLPSRKRTRSIHQEVFQQY